MPSPKGIKDEILKCLLVDSWYDSYLGVVILVRVIDGILQKGMEIEMMSNKIPFLEFIDYFSNSNKINNDKILLGFLN